MFTRFCQPSGHAGRGEHAEQLPGEAMVTRVDRAPGRCTELTHHLIEETHGGVYFYDDVVLDLRVRAFLDARDFHDVLGRGESPVRAAVLDDGLRLHRTDLRQRVELFLRRGVYVDFGAGRELRRRKKRKKKRKIS